MENRNRRNKRKRGPDFNLKNKERIQEKGKFILMTCRSSCLKKGDIFISSFGAVN